MTLLKMRLTEQVVMGTDSIKFEAAAMPKQQQAMDAPPTTK